MSNNLTNEQRCGHTNLFIDDFRGPQAIKPCLWCRIHSLEEENERLRAGLQPIADGVYTEGGAESWAQFVLRDTHCAPEPSEQLAPEDQNWQNGFLAAADILLLEGQQSVYDRATGFRKLSPSEAASFDRALAARMRKSGVEMKFVINFGPIEKAPKKRAERRSEKP